MQLRLLLSFCVLWAVAAEESGPAVLAAPPRPGPATTAEAEDGGGIDRPGELSVKTAAYQQNDSGGIEQVDEDATVFEAIIFSSTPITEKGDLNVRLIADLVSAASIEREHNAQYRALQSGASGNYRFGGTVGWSQREESFDWRVGAGGAVEYAYTSLSGNAGVTWHLNERNTGLGLDIQVYQDTVELIRYNGEDQGEADRDTYTVDLTWTQVLTPYSHLALVLSQTEQDGFLATSYNSVFVDGVEASEELPDSRSRTSITARYKLAVREHDAVEVGGRWYADDWGIGAGTLDMRYGLALDGGRLLLEPRYRLHVQDEADYYQEEWSGTLPEYRTSDPDLGDFTGHMFGLKATFIDRRLFGLDADWDLSANYYTRDNGLDMIWLAFGMSLEY